MFGPPVPRLPKAVQRAQLLGFQSALLLSDRLGADEVVCFLEAWTRRRLGSHLWRQWGNGHNRFNELRRRGVSQFRATVAAGSPTGFWRMSGHPAVQSALRNHYFDSIGLPRLYVPVRLNLVEPPWYATRMPGGVGGAAP